MISSLRKLFILVLFVVVSTQLKAQNTSFRSRPIKAKFMSNTPAEISFISPTGFGDDTRGFKQLVSKDLLLVGNIKDDDGLRLVLINNQKVEVASDGLFNITLGLKPGENEIIFYILDLEDVETKRTFIVETPAENNDLITHDGDYFALLIGVNDYEDPEISDLYRPIDDAKSLGKVLKNKYTFAEQNISYLENPTRSDIINALDKLAVELGPEDNLLIFYAGHGYWDEAKKTGYWIPANGKNNSTADWFRNTTLTDQLRTINTKHTLLIADACFSGSIFKSRSVSIAESEVAIKKLYDLPSRKAMTSGTLTMVPDDSEFMKFLVKRLNENTDTYLPSSDLFGSFRKAVINNSDVVPQYGTIQKAGDEGGDFIFIRKEE
ncbi:MAG: caspase family protein [Cyclobacteriaceae bacterium]